MWPQWVNHCMGAWLQTSSSVPISSSSSTSRPTTSLPTSSRNSGNRLLLVLVYYLTSLPLRTCWLPLHHSFKLYIHFDVCVHGLIYACVFVLAFLPFILIFLSSPCSSILVFVEPWGDDLITISIICLSDQIWICIKLLSNRYQNLSKIFLLFFIWMFFKPNDLRKIFNFITVVDLILVDRFVSLSLPDTINYLSQVIIAVHFLCQLSFSFTVARLYISCMHYAL